MMNTRREGLELARDLTKAAIEGGANPKAILSILEAELAKISVPASKCHKCNGNSITHASFCPHYNQAEEIAAIKAHKENSHG